MIIGLDIDDVIFNTSQFMEDVLGVLDDEVLNNYKIDIMRGDISIPVVRDFLAKTLPQAVSGVKVMDGAVDMLKEFRAAGDRIILITTRGDEECPGVERLSDEALYKSGIVYDEVVYNSRNKARICMERGVEVFVDDSPKYCGDVAKMLGIPVIGFASGITAEELEKTDIFCVKNWVELKTAIDELRRGDSL